MRTRILLTSLLILISVAAVRADDTWIDASGGTALPLTGHPTIRMVAEQVHINVRYGVVRARFVFRNEGPKTSVVMGFPEDGKPNPHRNPSCLFGFRSTVDGRAVRVRRLLQRLDPNDPENGYRSFWVKRVRFSTGQTRAVTVQYTAAPGHDTSGDSLFNYILATGRAWKGPIGCAEIVADLRGISATASLEVLPAGYLLRRERASWRFRNFEPNDDGTDDVQVSWFTGFRVNGARQVGALPQYRARRGPLEDFLAVRRGSDVFVSPQMASELLGARLTAQRSNTVVRLSNGHGYAEFRLGGIIMHSSSGPARLRHRVGRHLGNFMLPIRPLVKALGGSVQWNRGGAVDILIPHLAVSSVKRPRAVNRRSVPS